MGGKWWLRAHDEVFGPVSRDNLLEWAQMGRIQPGQEVSEDGESWRPATEVAFLDMRWSIDIGDGNPRGPFNKKAAQALLASGRLPPGSRLVETGPAEEETPAPADEAAPASAADSASAAEIAELRKQIETLQAGLKAAEARAGDAERRAAAARSEAKTALKAADVAEARLAAAMKARDDEQAAAMSAKEREAAEALAAKDREAAEAAAAREREWKAESERKDAAIAEKEASLERLAAEKAAREEAYEERVKTLTDDLKRMPQTAQLAADAQAAMYAIMKDEADELAAAIEAETREMEALREYRRVRAERLMSRRQAILRRIGTDADDMCRRALKEHPEDPRTVHLRQELEAQRLLQEKSVAESGRKIRDLAAKLRERDAEVKRLVQQAADVTVIYRQLQDVREKLMLREKELMETRQRAEAARLQHAAEQQALAARISSLEMGLPGSTNQSREARGVRLAPWMGLKS